MKYIIVNPIERSDWNNILLKNNLTSVFYSTEWAKVIHATYNYTPLYFCSMGDDDVIRNFLPFMGIKSILTGKRGVALPFTDECLPVSVDKESFKKLFGEIIKYGEQHKWRSIEIRGDIGLCTEPFNSYLKHEIDLNKSSAQLFKDLRSSTRRNIKKAQKLGVEIQFHNSLKAIKHFYYLNCITRKMHGLPPQPPAFFRNLYHHLLKFEKGLIVFAKYNQDIIAGALYLYNADYAIYKFGASDRRFQALRANNLIMWEAIKWFASNGIKNISLGRTEYVNTGLIQFKRGWGAIETELNYYKYDLKLNQFAVSTPKIQSSYWLFKKMPISLLILIGKLLYRHVG